MNDSGATCRDATVKHGITRALLTALGVLASLACAAAQGEDRPRARDLGIVVGTFEPGPLNAITDVPGVRVGHATLVRGDSVRTGVTVIFPHAGNPFHSRVPAAAVVGNGFGKFVGFTQLSELGELETPIALTCTLCVWRVADSMARWMLNQPDMQAVRSINPVVGETNDGWALNDIRSFPLGDEDVVRALQAAREGAVEEGPVGAGTGTVAFEWKGGIGTSSRVVPAGPWTVGVLVQSNFGGWRDLLIQGIPVGRELGRGGVHPNQGQGASGSIIVVVATNAPLSDRNLRRLAARALLGVGRTGSFVSNGSGEYAIAFSTSERSVATARRLRPARRRRRCGRSSSATRRRPLSSSRRSTRPWKQSTTRCSARRVNPVRTQPSRRFRWMKCERYWRGTGSVSGDDRR